MFLQEMWFSWNHYGRAKKEVLPLSVPAPHAGKYIIGDAPPPKNVEPGIYEYVDRLRYIH
jgi:hypothetical protein